MSEFWVGVVVGVASAFALSAIIGAWLAATLFETGDLDGE